MRYEEQTTGFPERLPGRMTQPYKPEGPQPLPVQFDPIKKHSNATIR